MSSLITYDQMERAYEDKHAGVLSHAWGRRYDPLIGPDKSSQWRVFPSQGARGFFSPGEKIDKLMKGGGPAASIS